MKTNAAVLYEMGKDTPYAVSKPLVVEEVELSEPGAGEVLIEIAAAGLCHSDLSVINGSRPRPMPMVLGHEASGIINKIGPGVKEYKPGDHIVCSFVPSCGNCIFCYSGRPALCLSGAKSNTEGTLLEGRMLFKNKKGEKLHHHLGISAFSNYTVVNQQSVIKIDPAVPLDKAALFGCGIMTGAGAVINTAGVKAGNSVAVFGLGGVGLSALITAKAVGAYPTIAIDLSASKLETAKAIGASHTINAEVDNPAEAIRKIIKNGVDFSFDCVGNEQVFHDAYRATARGGTTVAVGLPHFSVNFDIPGVSIVAEERTIKGSYMGSAVAERDIPRYIQLYMAGILPIDLLMTKTITLDEINSAFDALAEGEVVRQVIIF